MFNRKLKKQLYDMQKQIDHLNWLWENQRTIEEYPKRLALIEEYKKYGGKEEFYVVNYNPYIGKRHSYIGDQLTVEQFNKQILIPLKLAYLDKCKCEELNGKEQRI